MARSPTPLDNLRWRFVIALARAVTALPVDVALRIGGVLGAVGYRIARRRRHIAETNIALCFPELEPPARAALVRRTFRATGIALIETAMTWLRPVVPLRPRAHFCGLELLRAGDGRGVLLIGAHFSTLDLAGALLALEAPVDAIYRPHANPLLQQLMADARTRAMGGAIERSDTRTIVRRLRAGRTVWYAADQDFGRRHSVFAPFFGVPAATITAGGRLARAGNARVLFLSHFRTEEPFAWHIRIQPCPDGYPSGDDVADAAALNRLIEHEIRRDPAQYLWLHRRFKTRPEGEARPY